MRSLKINFYKYMLGLVTMFMSLPLRAQDVMENSDVAMADTMRENGKIYVVVVCLLLIFAGILTYLIILNRKVNKLEKMME
ncbi:MAG: CcmD family protein [Bacteroidia bacterium]